MCSNTQVNELLLPDRWGGSTVHLSVQDDFVVLQLCDDLVDASDHAGDSLRKTFAGLGLFDGLLLAALRKLFLDLLQVLEDRGSELLHGHNVPGQPALKQDVSVQHLVVLLNIVLQVLQLLLLQSQQSLLLLQLGAGVTQQINLFFGDLFILKG